MTPERWKQIDELAQSAIERGGDQRAAFLDAACAGDDALRREVESQIAYQQQASKFLEEPAFKHAAELIADCQTEAESMEGRTISHYRIMRKLGAGGMGEVYLAQDTTLSRKVAIKFLSQNSVAGEQARKRLVREAKAAAALDHPHICAVHEVGEQAGYNFIVMQYVEGETLGSRIQRQPLEVREALDIGVQIADALAEAHSHRIIHRDVKPQNVMLTASGQVKVLDFGLARVVREGSLIDSIEETESLLTMPGSVIGTVPYMSPEQVRGEALDGRSDIFSFGAVLYEMLSGRQPFQGESVGATMSSILTKDPAPLARYASDVPDELQRIVRKALNKDKEGRYQGIRDLLIDLRELKQELEFEAKLERSIEPAAKDLDLDLKRLNQRPEMEADLERGTTPEEEARRTSTRATGGSRPVVTGATQAVAAAQTAGGDIHTTSSAEYIVTEIEHHKRGALLVLAVLVVAIAGFAFYFARSGKAAINSVAVLPFVNVTEDPNTEYLSDGISESLINNLSQLPQLKVIARSSTFMYKGKEFDPEGVAKALGVQAIVTGRITQHGADLQISVELVNALDKTQMWGEQYNRRATDLQAVQAEVSRTISKMLRLRLTGAQEQRITKRATENPQAYQLYLTGLFYQGKGDIENVKKSLDYYNQAVALDPNFALAFARMTKTYLNLVLFSALDPKEALAKAKAAALKALELDETLADAHDALAGVRRYEWDWSGAESEYKRAFELDPNNAGAHFNYVVYLMNMGRLTEALAEIRRAEELDPLTSLKGIEAAVSLYARRYDEAIPAFQNVIKLQPDGSQAHLFLGYAYEAKGMYAEAINEYQRTISLAGETTSYLIYLGHAYAMSGKRDDALAILNKLKTTKEHVSPAELAILYAGLGDKEVAFQSLERAYSAHDPQMQYLKVLPHYDPLRSDPRFTDLMRRVGLTP
jgi:serine/threonine protein kinase/TolB-like protein/Flp pilus assembly protein TadD